MHDKVNELIARMQKQNSFPAISHSIAEINAKASATSNSSVEELADIILKDFSLTGKLLKVANSAMYGQFAGTIGTVSRAIVVLGFEQVRLTAAGLMFFESLQGDISTYYIKKGVVASIFSGIIARDLAKKVRLRDWENYYIGAMFHNFGQLISIHYFPDEFSAYRKLLAEGVNDNLAAHKAFGVSFADFGIGLAKFWGLPKHIIDSMKHPGAAQLKTDIQNKNHQQLLPMFANEICAVAMTATSDGIEVKLAPVLKKFEKIYPVKPDYVLQIVEKAIDEMKEFSDVLRFSPEDIISLERHHPDGEGTAQKLHEESPSARLNSLLDSCGMNDEDQAPAANLVEDRKRCLQQGIQDVGHLILDEFNLDTVLGKILETIYRGIGFDKVVIFIKDLKTGRFQARYALGQNSAQIGNQLSFAADNDSIDFFSRALLENRDLYIKNISEHGLKEMKPTWFDTGVFSTAFVLLPIVVNKVEIGLIYAGYNDPEDPLTPEQLVSLKNLRNQAALAIKQVSFRK